MRTFRGLPPEVLETLGLEPKGDEDEPDEPCGLYELPHLMAEVSPPRGVAGSSADQPGGPAPPTIRPSGGPS
jgi:hypothetical protein